VRVVLGSPAQTAPNCHVWAGEPEPRLAAPGDGEPRGAGGQGQHRLRVVPGQTLSSQ